MNTARAYQTESHPVPAATALQDSGYGRARLWLGITGVGLWVIVSVSLLTTDVIATVADQLPEGLAGDALLVGLLLAAYVLLQLPLDLLGGYYVPNCFGRQVQPTDAYVKILVRGIAVHSIILFLSATILYAGGSIAGMPGALIAGVLWMLNLAALRGTVAGFVAKLSDSTLVDEQAGTKLLSSTDEGFTGGITGLLTPKTNILPKAWKNNLSHDQFELAMARRETVISDGTWRKGRIGAFTFTSIGLLFALLFAGPSAAGTGVGVVETGLWFTLWSFLGLLILPTLSRAAIYNTDQKLMQQGIDPAAFEELTHRLDQLQDGEPRRARWIERIFHPIPSAAKRTTEPGTAGGFWNIARTSVYLGLSSLSLLTRSVHCNIGRPALWVWLPTD